MKYKRCTVGCCGDQLHKHQGICTACGHRPTRLQAFLMSNSAVGKSIQFTICILSKPTLSITVIETVVKAQGSLWWETETMEVERSNHPPFSMQYIDKSTYCHYSVISGTTTGTLLSLIITEHTLHQGKGQQCPKSQQLVFQWASNLSHLDQQ